MEQTNYQYYSYTEDTTHDKNRNRKRINVMLGEVADDELTELFSSVYTLVKPLPIKLSYDDDDDCYVVVQEILNLAGEAPTLVDAEKELATEVVRIYEKLSNINTKNPDSLGPYPRAWLSYLQEYII